MKCTVLYRKRQHESRVKRLWKADAGAESARSETLDMHSMMMMINARPLSSDEAQTFRAPELAVLISSLKSPRSTNGPRTGTFSSCSRGVKSPLCSAAALIKSATASDAPVWSTRVSYRLPSCLSHRSSLNRSHYIRLVSVIFCP